MKNNDVILIQNTEVRYPDSTEYYRPGCKYPEYPFVETSSRQNHVYSMVRDALHQMGLDETHFNSKEWNPLGEIISPGMKVLIKPNLVLDENKNINGTTDSLYTNPSVVAPIIDYVIIALKGSGKVIIGDAPVQECDFDRLIRTSGFQVLVDFYKNKGFDIDIVDFRGVKSFVVNGVMHSKDITQGNGTVVDLAKCSAFSVFSSQQLDNLRITNYKPSLLHEHHNEVKHEYMISNYILDADVIINMPKPKTHRIAGMTGALKNFVGANVRKEYLPHHTLGNNSVGGDESDVTGWIMKARAFFLDMKNTYEHDHKYYMAKTCIQIVRILSLLSRVYGSTYREGCWYGNHTISKTISDINRIVYFANKDGILKDIPQRKILILADMIVAGEKEGPMSPTDKKTNIIIAGFHPVSIDKTICALMGFDERKIPTIQEISQEESMNFIIRSNREAYDRKHTYELSKKNKFQFEATSGWKGHIEEDE